MAQPSTSVSSFKKFAAADSTKRVVFLLGAGLSASSGLPTFRGAGGLWRRFESIKLASMNAFNADPVLVWRFYSWRLTSARAAQPNPGHYAIKDYCASLITNGKAVRVITQNVDGLSPRIGHSHELGLRHYHGELEAMKCVDEEGCGWTGRAGRDGYAKSLAMDSSAGNLADANVPFPGPELTVEDLPHCPDCGKLARPGVVFFGDAIPEDVREDVENFIVNGVDLMIVVGTSAVVWPAAGYIEAAKREGARVCVVNMEDIHGQEHELDDKDWYFRGDAAVILPSILT